MCSHYNFYHKIRAFVCCKFSLHALYHNNIIEYYLLPLYFNILSTFQNHFVTTVCTVVTAGLLLLLFNEKICG